MGSATICPDLYSKLLDRDNSCNVESPLPYAGCIHRESYSSELALFGSDHLSP